MSKRNPSAPPSQMRALANELNTAVDVDHAIKVLAEAMGLDPKGPLGDLKFLAEEAAARLNPPGPPSCPACSEPAHVQAYRPYCSQFCARS